MIPLDDVICHDHLDPRLGVRDAGLIQQYAEIFDALPPIVINQKNELIDGWHRVKAAERAQRTAIAYVVVETDGDDDLADKMWAANLKHGVQYTRLQRQAHGLKLHERGLKAKDIAQRVGVSASSVYSWTKELREQEKQKRDADIARLREEGMTQQQIADELGITQGTIAKNIPDSRTGKWNNEPESESELTIGADEEKSEESLEAAEPAIPETGEMPAEEESDESDPEPGPPSVEATTKETSVAEDTGALELDIEEAPADEQPEIPELDAKSEPPPPEPIPIPADVLITARRVMGAFSETRPDDYVARLEAADGEWMTITDDSLSGEQERELLTSAAAMCLWGEQMIWYQGESASAFTDAFGKIGPVFVRGQAGQWRIVSRLRSILRRLWV